MTSYIRQANQKVQNIIIGELKRHHSVMGESSWNILYYES